MEDSKIIALFFGRSQNAIAECARKYGAYLGTVAYNILRSRPDSEEVVNDTYLGAWNAIPPAQPNVLRHFLSRITRSLALTRLDYMTAKKRGSALELLEELEQCCTGFQAENIELADCLNRFISSLTGEKRAIFLLRYYYGHSIAKIAHRCALSERRVKYQLGKTRSELRNFLESEGIHI